MEFGIVDERREDEGTLLFEGKGIANSEAWGRHGWGRWENGGRHGWGSGNWQRGEEGNESLYSQS